MNFTLSLLIAAALTATGSAALAQATIDQNKALSGGALPGDSAGFPITITQPGSYKLMSNLVVPQGSPGIAISADNVTLHLNGFTISGPVTCNGALSTPQMCSLPNNGIAGIEAIGNNAVIQGGSVAGFEGSGIVIRKSARLLDVTSAANAAYGLYVTGAPQQYQVHVERGTFQRNAMAGLRGAAVQVFNSLAVANGESGFWVSGGLLADSRSSGNANGGSFSNATVIRGNLFQNNVGNAYYLYPPAKSAGANYDGSSLF